jgi:hypothetical protein
MKLILHLSMKACVNISCSRLYEGLLLLFVNSVDSITKLAFDKKVLARQEILRQLINSLN